MKKIVLLILFSILLSANVSTFAQGNIQRFFPAPVSFARYNRALGLKLPELNYARPGADIFNQAVDHNNNGLSQMRNGDFAAAEKSFARACEMAPSEAGFWSNYLLAVRKLKGRETKAIKIAEKALALDPQNSNAAHIAGLILLNDLKQPLKALNFLHHALENESEDVSIAAALATAFDQAGYGESAFEILKKYAHKSSTDPYPLYMLGLKYLERKDYNPAIRAFNSARINDEKGYVHDAWIRSRYFAGQLEGLKHDCLQVLQRFTQIMNRDSLQRIVFSLQSHDFRLEEQIKVKLTRVSAIERLEFLVRPVPEIAQHQNAKLVRAEIVSDKGRSRARIVNREKDGRFRLGVNKDQLSSDFVLILVHRIKTYPLLGSQRGASRAPVPKINNMQISEKYSLDEPMVKNLADRIERMNGNYVQNAVNAVVAGLKYRENFEDHSVAWALQNPDQSDCTEFSRLLAALCLSKGYPARMVTGFLVKPRLMNKETAIGHAWCEVFFTGRGWVPIDPTLQSTMDWAYFGNLLSDQIYFGEAIDGESRISIDYTSSSSELQVSLSNTFKISNW
jgi:tetratricopeptide (TPR) repeat protein